MSSHVAEPRNGRIIPAARILAWLAVALFLFVYLLAPRGITVFWDFYIILFGPIVVVALSALVLFIICRLKGHSISVAYALMSVAVIVGIFYVTWFELRLRWYLIFN